jgi:hypothetical protein
LEIVNRIKINSAKGTVKSMGKVWKCELMMLEEASLKFMKSLDKLGVLKQSWLA